MLTITGGSRAVDNVTEKALQIAEVWAYLEAANVKYKAGMKSIDVKKFSDKVI